MDTKGMTGLVRTVYIVTFPGAEILDITGPMGDPSLPPAARFGLEPVDEIDGVVKAGCVFPVPPTRTQLRC